MINQLEILEITWLFLGQISWLFPMLFAATILPISPRNVIQEEETAMERPSPWQARLKITSYLRRIWFGVGAVGGAEWWWLWLWWWWWCWWWWCCCCWWWWCFLLWNWRLGILAYRCLTDFWTNTHIWDDDCQWPTFWDILGMGWNCQACWDLAEDLSEWRLFGRRCPPKKSCCVHWFIVSPTIVAICYSNHTT